MTQRSCSILVPSIVVYCKKSQGLAFSLTRPKLHVSFIHSFSSSMEGKRRQFERSRPYISVSNTETFVLTRRILFTTVYYYVLHSSKNTEKCNLNTCRCKVDCVPPFAWVKWYFSCIQFHFFQYLEKSYQAVIDSS